MSPGSRGQGDSARCDGLDDVRPSCFSRYMSLRRPWTSFVALAMCGALVGCGSLAEKAQSGPGGAADSLAVDGAGADSLAVDGVTGVGDSVGGVVGPDGTV